MNRQQAIGLVLQRLETGSGTNCAQHPAGRSGNWFLTPFPDAIRTMPIAARATDPVLMVALTAREDHMPQLARATALNRAEHFALLKCDLVMALTKKRLAMLPQTVGDRRHGCSRSRETSGCSARSEF